MPYTLLSPVGGVLADRTRKRGIMVGVNAALVAVLLAFLALKDVGDPFVLVVFATMASFVAQALYQPSIQSTVPFVLAPADVPRGVALVSQIGSLTTLGGPVVGAAVYGVAGLVPVVWISLAAFALSGAVVAVAVRFSCEPSPWDGGALAMVRDDLAEAFRFLRGKPLLLGGMATATFVNVSAGALINVGTVYVVTITLGLGAAYASFAQMAMGAGSLVGHSLLVVWPRLVLVEKINRLRGRRGCRYDGCRPGALFHGIDGTRDGVLDPCCELLVRDDERPAHGFLQVGGAAVRCARGVGR